MREWLQKHLAEKVRGDSNEKEGDVETAGLFGMVSAMKAAVQSEDVTMVSARHGLGKFAVAVEDAKPAM